MVQKNIRERQRLHINPSLLGKGHGAHEGRGTNYLVKLIIKLSLLSALHYLWQVTKMSVNSSVKWATLFYNEAFPESVLVNNGYRTHKNFIFSVHGVFIKKKKTNRGLCKRQVNKDPFQTISLGLILKHFSIKAVGRKHCVPFSGSNSGVPITGWWRCWANEPQNHLLDQTSWLNHMLHLYTCK